VQVWYGSRGLLSNLDLCLCQMNSNRKHNIFVHSLYGLHDKIKQRNWNGISRGLNNFRPRGCQNLFSTGKVFIAHNQDLHWVFYTIFISEKLIAFYDSMNSKSQPSEFPVQLLYDWLQHESHECGLSFCQSEWRFIFVGVPTQQNGVDCGFHMIRNTMLLQMDLPLMEYKVTVYYIEYHNVFKC